MLFENSINGSANIVERYREIVNNTSTLHNPIVTIEEWAIDAPFASTVDDEAFSAYHAAINRISGIESKEVPATPGSIVEYKYCTGSEVKYIRTTLANCFNLFIGYCPYETMVTMLKTYSQRISQWNLQLTRNESEVFPKRIDYNRFKNPEYRKLADELERYTEFAYKDGEIWVLSNELVAPNIEGKRLYPYHPITKDELLAKYPQARTLNENNPMDSITPEMLNRVAPYEYDHDDFEYNNPEARPPVVWLNGERLCEIITTMHRFSQEIDQLNIAYENELAEMHDIIFK